MIVTDAPPMMPVVGSVATTDAVPTAPAVTSPAVPVAFETVAFPVAVHVTELEMLSEEPSV